MFQYRQVDNTDELWNKAKSSATLKHVLSFAILFFVAAILLYSAHGVPQDSLAHHLLRDIGLAIVVALVIAFIYETYARGHFDTLLMNSALDLVLSDLSRRDIWREVQRQVVEKRAIRERLRLCIKLLDAAELTASQDPSEAPVELESGQMVLSMHLEYYLCGLRSLPSSVEIAHHLDKHLKAKKGRLPRFDFIHIDNGPNLKNEVNEKNEFTRTVPVGPRDSKPLHVSMCRKEIVHIPGVHCFTLSEMTKGIGLILLGVPSHLEVFYSLRPHVQDRELKENPPMATRIDDEIALPGQTIEFLFKRKDHAPAIALSPAAELTGTHA